MVSHADGRVQQRPSLLQVVKNFFWNPQIEEGMQFAKQQTAKKELGKKATIKVAPSPIVPPAVAPLVEKKAPSTAVVKTAVPIPVKDMGPLRPRVEMHASSMARSKGLDYYWILEGEDNEIFIIFETDPKEMFVMFQPELGKACSRWGTSFKVVTAVPAECDMEWQKVA